MLTKPLTCFAKPMCFAFILFSSAISAQDFKQHLTKLSQDTHRSDENIARNQYRNPIETLEFFGLKKSMSVVEIWPSSGWYTEIIAPALKEQGKYTAVGFEDNGSEWRKKRMKQFKDKLDAKPEFYSHVKITSLGTKSEHQIAPENSADMVLTFRNVHNWMKGEYAQAVFDQMFSALKPEGVLGVVEHRAIEGASFEEQIKSGYVTVDQVKAYAEKAGFKLVSSSELNANAKDSTRHPKGVWTLPPSFRLGEQDKAKYLAIGESDRMTLKFIKPAQ